MLHADRMLNPQLRCSNDRRAEVMMALPPSDKACIILNPCLVNSPSTLEASKKCRVPIFICHSSPNQQTTRMSPANASPSPMAAVWDRHAPIYEQVFERSTSLWGLDALTLASIPEIQFGQNKPRFLDVACGTGKFAIAVADMGYDVTATDLSSGMIERLKNKASKHTHLTLDTLVIDGQTLEGLSDNSFDYVSSIFGLITFPQRELAWKSALRVLKPGGQLLAASWHGESNNLKILQYIIQNAINKPDTVQSGGSSFVGPANRTIAVDSFAEELKEMGFTDVVIHTVRHDMSFKSGEEFVTGMFDNGLALAVLSQKDIESVKLTALHYFQQIIDGVDPFSPSAKPATVDPASSPFVPRDDNHAEDHPIWHRAFSFPAVGLIALARKA